MTDKAKLIGGLLANILSAVGIDVNAVNAASKPERKRTPKLREIQLAGGRVSNIAKALPVEPTRQLRRQGERLKAKGRSLLTG